MTPRCVLGHVVTWTANLTEPIPRGCYLCQICFEKVFVGEWTEAEKLAKRLGL